MPRVAVAHLRQGDTILDRDNGPVADVCCSSPDGRRAWYMDFCNRRHSTRLDALFPPHTFDGLGFNGPRETLVNADLRPREGVDLDAD